MSQIKKSVSLTTFCKFMPKIELHAHLNGSLNTETLKLLGCSDNSICEYQQLSDIMNKPQRTLEECFQLFKVAHNATKTKENVYLAAKSVIEDFNQQLCVYLEIRTTPRSEENMSKEEYIEAVIKAIKDCQITCQVLVKLILSIDRRLEETVAKDSLEVIIKMREKYPDIIKGIDLSGNPAIGIFDEKLFEKARISGLKTTIHCAEVKNDEEVTKILNFKPDRIGHAVFLHPAYGGSQANWELYCKEKIPVEMCLTSNVISASVKSYREHHVKEWIDFKLPFSINTDDTGIFATTLSKEYEHVLKHFELTVSQLWNITYESISHSFASDEEKDVMRNNFKSWFQHFQDTYLYPLQMNTDNKETVDETTIICTETQRSFWNR